MSFTLGKRKRPSKDKAVVRRQSIEKQHSASDPESEADESTIQDIFRKHFEAQFSPLPPAQEKKSHVDREDLSEDESEDDWSGLSEEEDDAVVIVEHSEPLQKRELEDKHEAKTFLVRLLL